MACGDDIAVSGIRFSGGTALRGRPHAGEVNGMPQYFILGNWTDKGIQNVRESPKRVDAVKALAEKLGGKLELYYTMGEYDFIAIANAPNDDAVMQLALQVGAQGNARTTTVKAWTVTEGTKVIAKVQ